MKVVGLDIGGANIKAASDDGHACCLSFPLWKNPSGLGEFLTSEVLPFFRSAERFALTLTGELCDCFEDKPDGVRQIIAAVLDAGIDPLVYSVEGSFVTPERACNNPLLVAAANWHALAKFSCRFIDKVPGSNGGMLIDIGSTSADLIPISRQGVQSKGTTDLTRILNHELVYTGVSRTPVFAVANRARLRGQTVPVAQELFATMQDVYLLLGHLPEQPENLDTADGRPLTRQNSMRRLARILCADQSELEEGELIDLAEKFYVAQLDLIKQACTVQYERLGQGQPLFICSGRGSFLAHQISESFGSIRLLDLADELGPQVCESAPAFALAIMLREAMEKESI